MSKDDGKTSKKSDFLRQVALVLLVLQGSLVAITIRYSRMPPRAPYRATAAVVRRLSFFFF